MAASRSRDGPPYPAAAKLTGPAEIATRHRGLRGVVGNTPAGRPSNAVFCGQSAAGDSVDEGLVVALGLVGVGAGESADRDVEPV